jgi:hypothetical protein
LGGAWRDLGFWSWGRRGAMDLGFRRFCPFGKAWVSLLGFGRGGWWIRSGSARFRIVGFGRSRGYFLSIWGGNCMGELPF